MLQLVRWARRRRLRFIVLGDRGLWRGRRRAWFLHRSLERVVCPCEHLSVLSRGNSVQPVQLWRFSYLLWFREPAHEHTSAWDPRSGATVVPASARTSCGARSPVNLGGRKLTSAARPGCRVYCMPLLRTESKVRCLGLRMREYGPLGARVDSSGFDERPRRRDK